MLSLLVLPFFFLPGLDLTPNDFSTASIVLVEGVVEVFINGMLAISFTAAFVVTLGARGSCCLAKSLVEDTALVDEDIFFDFFFFQNLSIFRFLYFSPNMGFSSQKEKGSLTSFSVTEDEVFSEAPSSTGVETTSSMRESHFTADFFTASSIEDNGVKDMSCGGSEISLSSFGTGESSFGDKTGLTLTDTSSNSLAGSHCTSIGSRMGGVLARMLSLDLSLTFDFFLLFFFLLDLERIGGATSLSLLHFESLLLFDFFFFFFTLFEISGGLSKIGGSKTGGCGSVCCSF